jgi:multiple sugar transport system permease protein
MKTDVKKNRLFLLFIVPALLWVVAFTVYPFFYSIYISLTNMSLMRPESTDFVWLENYRQLFRDKDFLKSVQISLTFTSWVVLFQFLLGFLLALLMANKRPLVSAVRMSVMLPWVLPPIALALIWAWVLKAGNTGLINSVLITFGVQPVQWFGTQFAMPSVILITVWTGVPLSFMLEMASLQKIPEELHEAASVDGANPMQRLLHIILPLMKDTFRINLIMITIASIGYFDIIYAITQGGPRGRTEVLPMLMYNVAFKSHSMGKGSAIAVVMLLMSTVYTLAYLLLFREKRGEEL